MAYTCKLFILTAALFVLTMSFMDVAIATSRVGRSTSSLATRLNLDEESPSTCWECLFQLQSCSNEVVLFFLNGETSLGEDCCRVIRTIERQCWPALLGTLGFTTEETDILKGYCDEVESPPTSTSTSHPPPSVHQPTAKYFPKTTVIPGRF